MTTSLGFKKKDDKDLDKTSPPTPSVCFLLHQPARGWAGIHDHYNLPIVQPCDWEF
jgi:hypothetical protein